MGCGGVAIRSEAFAKIQASSGISEFDEIMNTFASAEDENYRLYKYIDQLTQEIARLEEQINDIQVGIVHPHPNANAFI